MPTRPGWLSLSEALERVTDNLGQRPYNSYPTAAERRASLHEDDVAHRKLQELLQSGNVRARVFIANRAVPLTLDDLLGSGFGIHREVDGRPRAEVPERPDVLSDLIINEHDLMAALMAITRRDQLNSDPNQDQTAVFRAHLEEEVAHGRRVPRPALWKLAKSYGVKLVVFEALWNEIARPAGWSKPGRWRKNQ